MAELITGRVYIIRSPNTEMVYVGSTTMTLKQRFQRHISDWKNLVGKNTSYLILEKGEAYIELIEEVEVESKRELEIIEQIWIENTPNTVNIRRYIASVEGKVEYYKKYYIEHKELHKKNSKEYYNEHKEQFKKLFKERYEKNKAKITEKNKKKIQCICGGFYTTSNRCNHNRTAKHIRNLEMSS